MFYISVAKRGALPHTTLRASTPEWRDIVVALAEVLGYTVRVSENEGGLDFSHLSYANRNGPLPRPLVTRGDSLGCG